MIEKLGLLNRECFLTPLGEDLLKLSHKINELIDVVNSAQDEMKEVCYAIANLEEKTGNQTCKLLKDKEKEPELLPCEFCNGEGFLDSDDDHRWNIYCVNDDNCPEVPNYYSHSKSSVIEIWNRRA